MHGQQGEGADQPIDQTDAWPGAPKRFGPDEARISPAAEGRPGSVSDREESHLGASMALSTADVCRATEKQARPTGMPKRDECGCLR
jgi:hypothetical protein